MSAPRLAVTLLVLVLVLAAPLASAHAQTLPSVISMGTHRVGLSYHAVGVGIAKVVSEKSPMKVLVKPFAGPNAWMPLLDGGEIELGLLSGMDAGWAFKQGPGYTKRNTNLRVMARGNMVDVILITRASSDIRRLADVRGKRLTSDYGSNVIARNIVEVFLASGGLTWKDVKSVPIPDVVSGLNALRDGRVDVAFGGAPDTPRELDAAIPLRPIALESHEAAMAKAREILPSARPLPLKKGRGILREDTVAISYPNFLAASARLSGDAAYTIAKVLWEHNAELHPIHPWLRGWVREQMFDPDPPAPYHPGAVRFWKEVGAWTPAADKRQQELMQGQ